MVSFAFSKSFPVITLRLFIKRVLSLCTKDGVLIPFIGKRIKSKIQCQDTVCVNTNDYILHDNPLKFQTPIFPEAAGGNCILWYWGDFPARCSDIFLNNNVNKQKGHTLSFPRKAGCPCASKWAISMFCTGKNRRAKGEEELRTTRVWRPSPRVRLC